MAADIALFDDLEKISQDAAGGLDRGAPIDLFSRLSWFRLLARHCPPEGRLLVIRGRRGPATAWLFLAVNHPDAEAYGNYYSLRFDAIGDRQADVMTAIAAALRDTGIAQVELAPIMDPAPLATGLRNAGWLVSISPASANWGIETEGLDFEAYWAGRPAKLRNTARRRAKGSSIEVTVHDRFEEGAWADYEKVYRASWKPDEGSFPFLRALAEQEGAAGTLRLGLAHSEGRPVATQLWLVENGEATIHKLAYAEDAKAMSPGTILGMAMFRHALDVDRVTRIDYGNGDEAYKADWMAERRMLTRIVAFNPRTARGLIGAARRKASSLAAWLASR